ncbi:MAG: hypothetical protein ABMA64_09950 [Myxococcota bacterium]
MNRIDSFIAPLEAEVQPAAVGANVGGFVCGAVYAVIRVAVLLA